MPPSLSEVSEEVRVAFFIYDLLPDRWEGNAGYFLGKDLAPLKSFYDIYDVSNQEDVTTFLMFIEKINSKMINEELARKRRAEERKAKNSR